MVVLSFPLGLLWLWLASGAGHLLAQFGIDIGGASWTADIVVWLGFVVVGYLQWFFLLPWMIRKVRSRNRTTTERGSATGSQ
jgi:hypothetical protein